MDDHASSVLVEFPEGETGFNYLNYYYKTC